MKKQKPLLKKNKKNPQKTHVEPYSSAIMVPNGIHPIHVVTLQPCFKVRVICFLWIIECSTWNILFFLKKHKVRLPTLKKRNRNADNEPTQFHHLQRNSVAQPQQVSLLLFHAYRLFLAWHLGLTEEKVCYRSLGRIAWWCEIRLTAVCTCSPWYLWSLLSWGFCFHGNLLTQELLTQSLQTQRGEYSI